MLQVTRGAQFPLVQVRTRVPESYRGAGTIPLDLEIDFGGQKATYKQVPFQLTDQGGTVKLTGTIPAKLSDFKIEPPKLLTIRVKNDLPIQVEMTWRRQ